MKIKYNVLYNDSLNIPDKTSWVTLFRDLLSNLGFRHVLIQQNVGDKKVFLSLVKQRLSDTFVQNWNSRLTDSSRALFYRTLSFGYKSYLDNITTSKFRIALSRLRVCSHRLEIETGRWAKPNAIPIENRLCTSCQNRKMSFILFWNV